MDYHILDLYTLKSISRDINREIQRIKDRLKKLKEQQEVVDMIIAYRGKIDPHKIIDSDTLINPLK